MASYTTVAPAAAPQASLLQSHGGDDKLFLELTSVSARSAVFICHVWSFWQGDETFLATPS